MHDEYFRAAVPVENHRATESTEEHGIQIKEIKSISKYPKQNWQQARYYRKDIDFSS
jgi:hypothetical protein